MLYTLLQLIADGAVYVLIIVCHLLYVRETNLKVKQALTVTAELQDDLSKMAAFDGTSYVRY